MGTGALRRGSVRFVVVLVAVGVTLAVVDTAMATPPGENGLIVFAADESGSSQLYVVQPNGDHLRQITHVNGDASNPDWSPDGRRIVFEWALPNDAGAVIGVVAPNGTHLRMLSSSGGFDGQPSFTPDGLQVVFDRFDGNVDASIFIRALVGAPGIRRVTDAFPHADTDANVSPDGQRISFVRFRNSVEFQQALFTKNLRGGGLHRLTPYSFDVGIKQDWSPDGQRIVFTRDANPTPATPALDANLATIRADGTGLKMLTQFSHGMFSAFAGSYSPDGEWIVFRLENRHTGQTGLWKMHPDGTNRRLIFSSPDITARFIDWGPRPS
ncbi:MAG: TolB protein [Gaiellales bacterium]|nr:TolB protein [Gaiellales bacterium]